MIILLYIGLVILFYLLITFITTCLFLYIDRKEGSSAQSVYDDFNSYLGVGLAWPISFFIALYVLLSDKIKVWIITIVELLVLKNKKDEDTDH